MEFRERQTTLNEKGWGDEILYPIRTGLSVVTPPSGDVVTLAEAKAWARIYHTTEDALVTELLKTAVEEAERRTRKALLTRELEWTADGPPPPIIELPVLPASAVAWIKFYDLYNGETTVDPEVYVFDPSTGRVLLNLGRTWQWWPTGLRRAATYVVRFTAGYGAADDVPATIKTWIKQFVAHSYEHRGDDPATFPDGILVGRKTFRL